MKHLFWFLFFATAAHAVNNPCPQTNGVLTTMPTSPRVSGISPLLVFFDNSGVATSNKLANATAFQDVSSTWDFGDTLGSGNSTWRYGSNPGHNLRRFGIGNMTAHLYVTEGRDTKYTATITSTDNAGVQVKCGMGITVFDPSGSNGFPGAATTCISTSGNFTGCPASATHTTIGTFVAVNGSWSNKRFLFRCGETFTGGNYTASGTKGRAGAYGGCENTQTNRPIWSNTAGGVTMLNITNTAVDLAISDIDMEGAGTASNNINMAMNVLSTTVPQTQITIYNVTMNGGGGAFLSQQATQLGIVDSDMHARAGTSNIAVYYNVSANNCLTPTSNPYCGGAPGTGTYIVTDYQAMLGSDVEGVGGSGSNIEAFRVSAGSKSVYSNSTYNNAVNAAANFKLHLGGNTYQSCTPWLGKYMQYIWADNDNFGVTGNPFEVSPQNNIADERGNNIVVERFIETISAPITSGGKGAQISGQNITVRDGVMKLDTVGGNNTQNAMQTGSRGSCQIAGNCSFASGTCVVSESIAGYSPTGFEVFNVTGYFPTGHVGSTVVQNDTSASWGAAAPNSYFLNIMMYTPTAGSYTVVTNTGSGNAISNNTSNATLNPAFTNGSGLFNVLTDFKPTANFSGGAFVPVQYDALGIAWSPTWDLGAVKH